MVRVDDQLVPVRTWLLAAVISCLVRLLRMTWRVRFHDRDRLVRAQVDGAVVLTCWHGEQLCLIPVHRSLRIAGMISLSRDGDLLALVVKSLGYQVLRGGSSQGSSAVYSASLSKLHAGISMALAVDGPRGPWHSVKYGAARLSIESGRPIVFVVANSSVATVLRSWDRFLIPWPGARVDIAYGTVQPLMHQTVEDVTHLLEERMKETSRLLTSFSDLSGD